MLCLYSNLAYYAHYTLSAFGLQRYKEFPEIPK